MSRRNAADTRGRRARFLRPYLGFFFLCQPSQVCVVQKLSATVGLFDESPRTCNVLTPRESETGTAETCPHLRRSLRAQTAQNAKWLVPHPPSRISTLARLRSRLAVPANNFGHVKGTSRILL